MIIFVPERLESKVIVRFDVLSDGKLWQKIQTDEKYMNRHFRKLKLTHHEVENFKYL